MESKKAIIIGSGVAGMATAIRLATKGFEVSVYEKNDKPGGKLTAFENNGFKFDAGPSLFTAPNFIEDLFADAGEPIKEYFSYTKLPIACKYFYNNETIINAYTDKKLFANELKEKLNEDANNIEQYLITTEKLHTKTGHFFINNSLQKFRNYFSKNFIKAFGGFKLKHLTRNLHSYNNTYFNNSKTTQLFDRFATYNGSNPYKASAMLSQIAHLEHNDGAYYPKGGMIAITNALYKLALKKGVEFNFNTTVNRIIATNNKVKGIVVNGKNILASVVISNTDAYFTYKNLLQNTAQANKILKKERSSSAVIFYWGINKEFEQLNLHNILFSNDYKKEFEYIFKNKKLFEDPTVYINITAKIEVEQHAPKGKENWFVMINAPSNPKTDWDSQVKLCKKYIVNKINSSLNIDIEKHIETENILHPNLIETNTGSYCGSLYGTSSNRKLAAFFRHSNFNNAYKGLYFVGGSVHPGGGIPLCLKSSEIVAKMIATNF